MQVGRRWKEGEEKVKELLRPRRPASLQKVKSWMKRNSYLMQDIVDDCDDVHEFFEKATRGDSGEENTNNEENMPESEHAAESGYGTIEHYDIAISNLENAEPEPIKTGKVLVSKTSGENVKMVADKKERRESGESEDTLATAAENDDITERLEKLKETSDDDAYGSEEDTASLEKRYFTAMVELKLSKQLDIIIAQACDDQQNPLLRIQRGGGYVGLAGMMMSEEEAPEFWKFKHQANEVAPFIVTEQYVSRNYQDKLPDNSGHKVSAVEFAVVKIYEHVTCEASSQPTGAEEAFSRRQSKSTSCEAFSNPPGNEEAITNCELEETATFSKAASEPTEVNNINEEQAAISSKVPTSAEMEQPSKKVKITNCEAEETSTFVEAASEPTDVNSISEEQAATSSKVPTSVEIETYLHELPTLTAVTEYDSTVTFEDGLPSMVGGQYNQMNINNEDLVKKKTELREEANENRSKEHWYVTKKMERSVAVALAFICWKQIIKYGSIGKDIPADVFRSALEDHKNHPLWFVISALSYQKTIKDTLRSFIRKYNKNPEDTKFEDFVMEGRQMVRDFTKYSNE